MNTVRHPRRFIAVLFPLIAFAAFVFMSVTSAKAATCHVYQVTINGYATIGDNTTTLTSQPFSVVQYAAWRDAGYAFHPYEFVLFTPQDLNLSAQIGQIRLMTNSAFAENFGIASARFDLATMSILNVVYFQLDSGMSFQLPSPNVFVAPNLGGSLGGLGFLTGGGAAIGQILNGASILSTSLLVPRTGSGYFYTPDSNSIAGQLNLVGTSLDNLSFQGQYWAEFGGSYLGSAQCD